MIVCIFEHVQWRWELNDRLAHGYHSPAGGLAQREPDGRPAAGGGAPARLDLASFPLRPLRADAACRRQLASHITPTTAAGARIPDPVGAGGPMPTQWSRSDPFYPSQADNFQFAARLRPARMRLL